jgi:hypothetical protein
VAVAAKIFGGEGNKRHFGVWLYHDAAALGLSSGRGKPFTSEALANASDANTAEWMGRVPTDRIEAIRFLRRGLATEADPIQRHYMFNALEEYLYACREAFASALTDFV